MVGADYRWRHLESVAARWGFLPLERARERETERWVRTDYRGSRGRAGEEACDRTKGIRSSKPTLTKLGTHRLPSPPATKRY
jgi:hypothetical protein